MATKKGKSEGTTELAQSFKPAFTAGRLLLENSNLIGQKTKIKLGAGEKIAKVGMVFFKESLTGFEEIAGIPGTIGGAVRMNAGANGREMKDIIKTVKCLDYQGNEKIFTNEEMEFGYRTSILKKEFLANSIA